MSSITPTRATKRSAAEAELPNSHATVIAPAGTPAELLAAGGPAPQPQVAGFTAPVPVVAEETTGHKAKRLATEAAQSVSTAVSSGLESASAAVNSAAVSAKQWSDRELVRTGHSNAPGATALNSELPVEPTLRDKTHNTLNTVQFGIERAAEATLAASKVAVAKIAEGIHVLGEKLEPAAAAITAKSTVLTEQGLAQAAVLAEQGKAKIVGPGPIAGDKQVSDASHLATKEDGSLPVERNADEFSTHARTATFEGDNRIASSSAGVAKPLPGQSGLGTDKIVDAPAAKIDAAPQVDLITGDAKPLVV